MLQWVRGLALGAMLVMGGDAAAQDPPVAPKEQQQDIVVNGTRDMGREIRDFVGALTPTTSGRQLSRFEQWAVCPAAVGFTDSAKQAIVARLRKVAEAAGIRVDKPSCYPNVVLIATADKKAFLEALSNKHPEYFGDMTPSEVRRVLREPGPATAWQLQGVPLNADGKELRFDETMGQYVNETTAPPSRITAATRPHFAAAVVVVESKVLPGLTPVEIADYAAMRAYARTDPRRLPESSAPTILKILDAPPGSEVPLSLTEWDLGFLRALYASPANLYVDAQRSDMRRHLEKELKGSDGERN